MDLLPLTAWRLLGGAPSSTALDAGLFLSSILARAAGRGRAEVEVAIGIRKGAATGGKREQESNKDSKWYSGGGRAAEWAPVVLGRGDYRQKNEAGWAERASAGGGKGACGLGNGNNFGSFGKDREKERVFELQATEWTKESAFSNAAGLR